MFEETLITCPSCKGYGLLGQYIVDQASGMADFDERVCYQCRGYGYINNPIQKNVQLRQLVRLLESM